MLKPKVGTDRPNNPHGEGSMDRKVLTGAILAAAVGAIFLTTPLFAQESAGSSSQASVKCVGGNSCKGQSSCKGGNHSCKGLNACKGQGFVSTASAQQCTDKGGHPEQAKN
jgi:hypothetical protein